MLASWRGSAQQSVPVEPECPNVSGEQNPPRFSDCTMNPRPQGVSSPKF